MMKKTKFTIIDICIVLIAIALVVVGISVVGGKFSTDTDKEEVYFTVLVDCVDEGMSNIIKENDRISISYSEELHATVVEATEEPHMRMQFLQSKNQYMTHALEGKSDVKVVLKCDAEVTENEISNGSVNIRVGEGVPVYGKGYSLYGYIIDVEEK